MLADEKSAHAAAHILRTLAANDKVLVADLIVKALAGEDASARAERAQQQRKQEQEQSRRGREQQQREREQARREREQQQREREQQQQDYSPWQTCRDSYGKIHRCRGSFYVIYVQGEFEKAYAISKTRYGDRAIVPKSYTRLLEGVTQYGEERMWIADWLAREKGIEEWAE
jgi:DNA repair exonuclease SbcCD ATPase subunit